MTEFRHVPPGAHFVYEGEVFMRVIDRTVPADLQDRNAVCLKTGHLWSFMLEEGVETLRVDLTVPETKIKEGYLSAKIKN